MIMIPKVSDLCYNEKNRRGCVMNKKREVEQLDERLAFKIIADGKEVICYIVLHFENKETGKKYIIYTDGSKQEDGTLELLASTYEIKNESMILGDIVEKKEWDMIDDMLAKAGELNGKE